VPPASGRARAWLNSVHPVMALPWHRLGGTGKLVCPWGLWRGGSCPCVSEPGPIGLGKARPGWPRDARAGRPRHNPAQPRQHRQTSLTVPPTENVAQFWLRLSETHLQWQTAFMFLVGTGDRGGEFQEPGKFAARVYGTRHLRLRAGEIGAAFGQKGLDFEGSLRYTAKSDSGVRAPLRAGGNCIRRGVRDASQWVWIRCGVRTANVAIRAVLIPRMEPGLRPGSFCRYDLSIRYVPAASGGWDNQSLGGTGG
jgi:hypothetical protein